MCPRIFSGGIVTAFHFIIVWKRLFRGSGKTGKLREFHFAKFVCTLLVVVELFDVEYYCDLEICLRGHSRSLNLVPFKSLGAVSYSLSIVTMAVSVAVCEIFSVKEWCDLENGVRFRSKIIGNGTI